MNIIIMSCYQFFLSRHLLKNCFSRHSLTQPDVKGSIWSFSRVRAKGTQPFCSTPCWTLTWLSLSLSTPPQAPTRLLLRGVGLIRTGSCWASPCHCAWWWWWRWWWRWWLWWCKCQPSADVVLRPESNLIVACPAYWPPLFLLLKSDKMGDLVTMITILATAMPL